MKNILTRMKTLVKNKMVAGATLEYVQTVEVLHPDIELSALSVVNLPRVCIIPESCEESWVASQEKQSLCFVSAFLIMRYIQRESSIIGDASRGTQGKGIVDFVTDFLDCVRGHRLAVNDINYLSKPMDVLGVDYVVEHMGDQGSLLIAKVSLKTERLFIQQTLPGNV